MPAVDYARNAIHWLLPVLYVLISTAFYLRTYDSAQVKITLLQMGGLSLVTMWMCLLLMEGRKAIHKQDLVFLAPFLLYAVYIIISFLNAPYKWLSTDDFVRYLSYMGVSLIVISEFDEAARRRFTKIFIAGAIITVAYGILQIVDFHFCSHDPSGLALDPFLWRAAFGPRVFSTYGNPNFFADFVLIMFFIFISQYLKTRSFWYLPVIAADLLCLYCTDTKGAWMGFAIGFVIFVAIYSVFFLREYYERYRTQINAIALTVLVSVTLGVGIAAKHRFNSVSFRVFTWLSTWEMIETRPLTGTGVGSFKVIYPAFRRPQIFHIEGKHNTETDHAEDEYLEQWFDNGMIGFGLFLWIVIFTVTTGLRGLRSQTADLAATGMRAPPQAYDLLGYLTAFTAMMSHNFFDVSMRFVSSGIYLGLLPGLVIVFSRGYALYELRSASAVPAAEDENRNGPFWLWLPRLAAMGGLVWLFWRFCQQFDELQGNLDERMVQGDYLQWHIAWVVFIALAGWVTWKFVNIVWKSRSFAAILLVLAMLYPMNLFWGFFRANVYHNMAIFFSKNKDWDNALEYYDKTSQYDPSFVMAYYFRGNVFKDRFDETPQYNEHWGDKGNVYRTDYERALDDYAKLRKLAPNYVQTYYQMGELYMKRADELTGKNKPAEAAAMLDKAMYCMDLYHNLDPVFPYVYYHRARIYEVRGQIDKARQEYEDNINAPFCHEKGHMHESAEAYIYLGMFEMRQNRLEQAEAAFRRATEVEPGNPAAKTDLQAVASMRHNKGAHVQAQPMPAVTAPVQ